MRFFLPLILVVLVACNSNNNEKPDIGTPSNDADKISYTIGYEMGTNFRNDSIEVNPQALLRGIMDAMADDTTEALALMKKADRDSASMKLSEKMQKKNQDLQAQQNKAMEEVGKASKLAGEKYLAENAKKSGVTTLPSGIQYKVLAKGSGKSASSKSVVKMHLVAKFIDGSVFDDTHAEGRGPVDLPVEQLIPGWQAIIPMMKVGDKWEVTIPYNMAYGEQGYQNAIPPYSTLVFEMELLEIVK